jgi:hypothetical protein
MMTGAFVVFFAFLKALAFAMFVASHTAAETGHYGMSRSRNELMSQCWKMWQVSVTAFVLK